MAAAFEQVIRLQMQKYSPEAARRKHIEVARKGLAAYLGRQQEKPGYTIDTDGHPASSEESVRPFGVITYRFTRLKEVVRFALDFARLYSPIQSGRYRKSWFAMADGRQIEATAIPGNAREIIVTNDQPYSRKINVGAEGFEKYAHPGVAEKVAALVKKRYGSIVEVRIVYITLAGGHTLKRSGKGRRRRSTRAGADLTYPSIRIISKF